LCCICVVLLVSLLFLFTGCPTEGEETTNNSNTEDLPVEQDPIDPANPRSQIDKKVDGGGQKVVHEVWMGIDTNADPRCAVGYKLAASKKQFFDNAVIFHSDLAWKDCGGTQEQNYCPKSGLHLHYTDETQWLINPDDYNTYIKPLKDAGIRVLLGILPCSHGVTFGNVGSWPMEPLWSWQENTGEEYPLDEDAARALAQEWADACEQFGFDGIALDDEYGDLPAEVGVPARGKYLVYPTHNGQSYGSGAALSDAWKKGGENVFKLCRYFKDLTKDTEHPNGKWVSIYEYNYLSRIPSSLTVDGQNYNVADVVDASYPASYGTVALQSSIGSPKSNYGCLSIAFDAFAEVTTPPNMIKSRMNTLLKNGYGVVMYFALKERRFYSTKPFFGPTGTMPEDYLSRIAEVLYKDTVIYEGPDYLPFPVERNGSTQGTGALYGHK
ncbi:MAG: hypothetical protein LBD18_01390, partial [Treponema sp.]|nr:hypothetical protein [Treponema sp.]